MSGRITGTPLVRGALLAVVVIAAAVYFFGFKSNQSAVNSSGSNNASGASSANPTPLLDNDKVARLIAVVEGQQNKIKEFEESLPGVVNRLVSSRGGQPNDENKIKETIGSELKPVHDQMAELRKAIEDFKTNPSYVADRSVEAGGLVQPNSVGSVDSVLGESFEISDSGRVGRVQRNSNPDDEELTWVYPVGTDAKSALKELTEGFNPLGNGLASRDSTNVKSDPQKNEPPPPVPYITLHKDAILTNAVLTSSLIGRIPTGDGNGAINPYEFNLLIKGSNIMANGHSASEISHAMATGVAVGDVALGCSEGRITSLSFVFKDGRIWNASGDYEKPLGKIGDLYGNKCVKGEKVGDIGLHIAGQSAIGAFKAVADTVKSNQQTFITSGDNVTPILSGDASKAYGSSALGGGLDATSRILADRYKHHYEAFYTPKGIRVNIYLNQEIGIDYIPTNRKVRYESNTAIDDIFG